jgi:hypothetical protein
MLDFLDENEQEAISSLQPTKGCGLSIFSSIVSSDPAPKFLRDLEFDKLGTTLTITGVTSHE